MNKKITLGSLLLTMTIAGSLYAAGKPSSTEATSERARAERRDEVARESRRSRELEKEAEEREKRDDPGARARWVDLWYNENYPRRDAHAKGPSGARLGYWSPGYQRFLMEAAKRERIRYHAKMPASPSSDIVIDPKAPIAMRVPATGPASDLKWTNLGPTKANFLRNGDFVLNATDTGRVSAIASAPNNPNLLYVAFAGGGLWKSTDGGAFWQAKTETLGTLSIGALALDPNNPNTLYLGLGDPHDGTGLGIVKMTNGGDDWEAPRILGTSTTIRDIIVAPGNTNIVMVATNAGLFRSTDAGKTYAEVAIPTGQADKPALWSFAWTGGSSFVLSLEASPSADNVSPNGQRGQVWRSADNGATWTQANGVAHASGLNRITVAAAPSNRSVLYAMASRPNADVSTADLANLYKSIDGGANWTTIGTLPNESFKPFTNPNADWDTLEKLLFSQGGYNQVVLVDRNNPNIAYFGGALIAAKTGDGGNTFSILTDWLADFGMPYVHADFHAGHISSNNTLYFGTDGGIFASTNGGSSFTHTLNEGIASHLLYSVCTTPANTNAVMMGLQDNGTRLRESNTGVFNQVLGGDGFGCDINRSNANLMVGSIQYLDLYRSTNGGATFTAACTGIAECGKDDGSAPFRPYIKAWSGNATGDTLYTAASKKLYRSTNYAGNWTALGTTGLPGDLFIRNFTVAHSSESQLAIAANGGRVYSSSTGGGSWTALASPPNNGLSLSSISFDPTNTSVLYLTSAAADATKTHAWRSLDSGASWAAIDGNGFPTGVPVNSITIDPNVNTTLYAATHLGVYRSLDRGVNWERFGAFLPLVNVMEVTVSPDGNTLHAATYGRGVWRSSSVGANVAPVANFSSTSNQLTTSFTDNSTDSDGTVVRRQWNFGDGVSSSTTSPQHTYATPGTYTVSLTVTDDDGYTHTKTVSVTVGGTKVHNDLNGDGRSDLVWFNTTSSSMAYWWMNNTAVLGTGQFPVGSTFRIAATGDLDGDGRTDIIWRDNTTNYHYLWRSRGDGTFDTPFLGAVATGWTVARITDINGDGRDDIVWENTGTGQMAYWLMNGATTTGTGVFTPGTAYRIVGAGDFDGDGRGDILWANSSVGYLYLWRSRGDGTFDTPFVAGYGTTWNIAGISDVNGDGRSDIVWEEPTQGLMAYWFMNGATVSSTGLKSVGTAYRIATTGDLDGDGRGDIVWANASTGYLYLWRSLGNGNFDTPFLAAYATSWSLLP